MRRLTVREIQSLANRKGVDKEAVEEFLYFMPHEFDIAINCAKVDADLYDWNENTLRAVLEGIKTACDKQIVLMR